MRLSKKYGGIQFFAPPITITINITVNGEVIGLIAAGSSVSWDFNLEALGPWFTMPYIITDSKVIWENGQPLQHNGIGVLATDIIIDNGVYTTGGTSSMSKTYDLSTSSKWANLADGDHIVKLRARGAGYGSSSFSNSVTVTKGLPVKSLEDSTWAEISQVSANKQWDAMGWKVGDTKTITLNGNVGSVALNNYQCKVYILGFDHNSAKEGSGISFGLLESTDGVQLCLYSFAMNTSSTNSGGWKACNMRKTFLGSTDTANGDATPATITNPVANTLMAALPSDLRSVLKPITKYTNNVGQSSTASATPTIDYLPLMSEFEVFGSETYANTNEKTYQVQYQYYVNGKSKILYNHSDVTSSKWWWLRSPNSSASSFCCVRSSGYVHYDTAYATNGIAPVFLV